MTLQDDIVLQQTTSVNTTHDATRRLLGCEGGVQNERVLHGQTNKRLGAEHHLHAKGHASLYRRQLPYRASFCPHNATVMQPQRKRNATAMQLQQTSLPEIRKGTCILASQQGCGIGPLHMILHS